MAMGNSVVTASGSVGAGGGGGYGGSKWLWKET